MKPTIPSALLAIILASSCASSPAQNPSPVSPTVSAPASQESRPTVQPPGWTTKTVFVEGTGLTFVLTGPEKADVVDLALQAMTATLDLPLAPSSPATAVQAVQKFLKKMSATVPSERYFRDGKGWWKVVLAKEEWDSSRAQLKAALEVASADPSMDLEKSADELVRQGRYSDAVTGYVAAASAAASQPVLAARFRATLAKAQNVLSQFTLSSTTAAVTTQVGRPFGTSFDVKLSYGAGTQAVAIPSALLRFSYKTKINGHLAVTGVSVKTDAQGLVKFELPVADFPATDSVVVLVDVTPWLETLAAVPADLKDSVTNLETVSGERKLLLPYTIESAAKQVPLIVALADFDEKGGLERRQETTNALIVALQKSGFQTSGVQVNLSLLKSANDNVILTAWKFQGKTSGRAVFGTVNLVSVVVDGSQYRAEVSGVVKVVDLATSKPVYQLKTTKVAGASDRGSSITQAFRQWASEAAAAMEAELP